MHFLRKLIPDFIKKALTNRKARKRYDVKIYKGAFVNRRSVFEGRNIVYDYTEVSNSDIGFGTYIARFCKIRSAKIGRYCTIGENVRTFLGKHPTREIATIHPAFYSTARQAGFTFVDRQVFDEHTYVDDERRFVAEIGNDVWIGNDVNIVDGVTIADGAIVAAGSIVTKDVPAYAIYGGMPAKLIRYRFDPAVISFLLDFKWWNKDYAWLEENHRLFANVENLKTAFQSEVSEMPVMTSADGNINTVSA